MVVKTKDWWIYQERKTESPWALHLIIKKDKRSVRCEGELFAEWVSCDSHKFVFHLLPLNSLKDYLQKVMNSYGIVMDEQDQMQIDYEVKLIKESFR